MRIEWSTPAGWKAAANVFRVGTVSPNPAPRLAVASSSSQYAPGSSGQERAHEEQGHRGRLAARPTR